MGFQERKERRRRDPAPGPWATGQCAACARPAGQSPRGGEAFAGEAEEDRPAQYLHSRVLIIPTLADSSIAFKHSTACLHCASVCQRSAPSLRPIFASAVCAFAQLEIHRFRVIFAKKT
ncbi:unnamed protein product [Prorocentrum cordatum]|uniref:Uncharacterized protein n=1 Tax=Prorocentrum cordatum TaxID=2364126 RepID=A0ABN9X1W4_9DINO|nr:unnamed protein product [Polarella glacialis]